MRWRSKCTSSAWADVVCEKEGEWVRTSKRGETTQGRERERREEREEERREHERERETVAVAVGISVHVAVVSNSIDTLSQ